jgi:hypothetical protein
MELAAVTVGKTIWTIGGADANDEPTDTVQIFRPATRSWSAGPPLAKARYNLTATRFDGAIYAIGGQNGTAVVPTVEVLHSGSSTWTSGPPLPQGLTRLGSAVLDGRLHVVEAGEHVVLNADRTGWTEMAPAPTSRKGLRLATLKGQLYAVGGCRTIDSIDTGVNEVYQP